MGGPGQPTVVGHRRQGTPARYAAGTELRAPAGGWGRVRARSETFAEPLDRAGTDRSTAFGGCGGDR